MCAKVCKYIHIRPEARGLPDMVPPKTKPGIRTWFIMLSYLSPQISKSNVQHLSTTNLTNPWYGMVCRGW